jgi:hypothetical protein
MSSPRVRWLVLLTALIVSSPLLSARETPPSLSRDRQAQFLATARIISHKNIPKGVTHPIRLTLTDGTITHDAAFSTINETKAVMKFSDGRTELNFVDSYKYTVAAYQIAQLIGLEDMTPVAVARSIDSQTGSLTWWVDGVQFDEGDRVKQSARPPDPGDWSRQMFRMRVFTQLVADADRNQTNLLITNDWKLWMIDFTRAFRLKKEIASPLDVTRCDRELMARMQALTRPMIEEKTKHLLNGGEIDALLARRDAIVARLNQLVAERGEALVLY